MVPARWYVKSLITNKEEVGFGGSLEEVKRKALQFWYNENIGSKETCSVRVCSTTGKEYKLIRGKRKNSYIWTESEE